MIPSRFLAFLASVAAAGLSFALAWFEVGDVARASAAAALTLVTGLAGWRTSQRWDVAAGAALVTSAWPGRLWADPTTLASGALLGLLVLLPKAARPIRAVAALVAGFGVGWLALAGNLALAVSAAVASAGMALVQPTAPTHGTLRVVRTTSLYFPSVVLGGLLVLNAVTERGETFSPSEVVRWTLGLFLLLILVTLAGLGLEVLLRSNAPVQGWVWASGASAAVILVLSSASKDASTVLATTTVGAPVVGLLGVLAIAWMTRSNARIRQRFPLILPAALASGAWALLFAFAFTTN